MVEKVTPELSEEVVQRAHAAASRTKRALEEVLAEWTTRGADYDVGSLIVPGVEYPIYTPFGNEAASQVLLEALKAVGWNYSRTDKIKQQRARSHE
jgi:hypothetical protein